MKCFHLFGARVIRISRNRPAEGEENKEARAGPGSFPELLGAVAGRRLPVQRRSGLAANDSQSRSWLPSTGAAALRDVQSDGLRSGSSVGAGPGLCVTVWAAGEPLPGSRCESRAPAFKSALARVPGQPL